MLLWNSCLRMRGDDVSDSDKAAFAVNAWIESTVIEEALDAHTCGCDQAFLFQGREYLFMCVWRPAGIVAVLLTCGVARECAFRTSSAGLSRIPSRMLFA
jgi:hypothetical protein